jgi:hypothetical protein
MAIERTTLEDGTVRLASERCAFTYHRLRPGVVLVRIEGLDRGEFGTRTVDELREDLSRFGPIEVFFDLGDTSGATVNVSDMWTEWFREHRANLKSVSILVRSKFVHLTIEVSKLFSRTGELIRIYLDEARFEEAIARAAPGFTRLPASTRSPA